MYMFQLSGGGRDGDRDNGMWSHRNGKQVFFERTQRFTSGTK